MGRPKKTATTHRIAVLVDDTVLARLGQLIGLMPPGLTLSTMVAQLATAGLLLEEERFGLRPSRDVLGRLRALERFAVQSGLASRLPPSEADAGDPDLEVGTVRAPDESTGAPFPPSGEAIAVASEATRDAFRALAAAPSPPPTDDYVEPTYNVPDDWPDPTPELELPPTPPRPPPPTPEERASLERAALAFGATPQAVNRRGTVDRTEPEKLDPLSCEHGVRYDSHETCAKCLEAGF